MVAMHGESRISEAYLKFKATAPELRGIPSDHNRC